MPKEELKKFFAAIEARPIFVPHTAAISGFQCGHIRNLLVQRTIPKIKLGRD